MTLQPLDIQPVRTYPLKFGSHIPQDFDFSNGYLFITQKRTVDGFDLSIISRWRDDTFVDCMWVLYSHGTPTNVNFVRGTYWVDLMVTTGPSKREAWHRLPYVPHRVNYPDQLVKYRIPTPGIPVSGRIVVTPDGIRSYTEPGMIGPVTQTVKPLGAWVQGHAYQGGHYYRVVGQPAYKGAGADWKLWRDDEVFADLSHLSLQPYRVEPEGLCAFYDDPRVLFLGVATHSRPNYHLDLFKVTLPDVP